MDCDEIVARSGCFHSLMVRSGEAVSGEGAFSNVIASVRSTDGNPWQVQSAWIDGSPRRVPRLAMTDELELPVTSW